MSVFSGTDIHNVDNQITRVIDDNILPNTPQKALLTALFSNANITSSLIEACLDGPWLKFENFYRAAEEDEIYGLPEVYLLSSSAGSSEVIKAIASDIDYENNKDKFTDFTMDYVHYRPRNYLHAGWVYATEELGYRLSTNELESITNEIGWPVFLDKLEEVYNPTHNKGQIAILPSAQENSGQAAFTPAVTNIGNWGDDTKNRGTPDFLTSGATIDSITDDTSLPEWSIDDDQIVDLNIRIGNNEIDSCEIHYVYQEIIYAINTPLHPAQNPDSPIIDPLAGQPYRVIANSDGSVFYAETKETPVLDKNGNYVRDEFGVIATRKDYVYKDGWYVTAVMSVPLRPDGTPSNLYAEPPLNSMPIEVPANTPFDTVMLHTKTEVSREVKKGIKILKLDHDKTIEYYQARYSYINEIGDQDEGYWTYTSPGRHTALDAVPKGDIGYTNPGTYFPIVPFREDGRNVSIKPENPGEKADRHASTVRITDALGMDYEKIGESLHESEGISDIEQAIMTLGVSITAQSQVEIEYLHTFFKELMDRLPPPYIPDPDSELESLTTILGIMGEYLMAETIKNFTYQAAYTINYGDKDYRQNISFEGIERRLVAGNVEDVNNENDEIPFLGTIGTLTNTYGNDVISERWISGRQLDGVVIPSLSRVFRKQLTTLIYEEVLVKDPQAKFYIVAEARAEAGAQDDNLLIPLDYDLARRMNVFDREILYSKSLHFVFNSYVKQKGKWYTSGAFKVAMVIVAVAIAVYTGQFEFFAAVLATEAALYAAIIIIVNLVIQYAISQLVMFAIGELVKLLGIKNTFILVIVLIVSAVVVNELDPAIMGKMLEIVTVENLILIASNLLTGISAEAGNQYKEIADESDDFNLMAAQKYSELQEAQKELDTQGLLDPFTFTGSASMLISNESPDAFYNRTIHDQNPGIGALNIVQNYVEISLTLPVTQF